MPLTLAGSRVHPREIIRQDQKGRLSIAAIALLLVRLTLVDAFVLPTSTLTPAMTPPLERLTKTKKKQPWGFLNRPDRCFGWAVAVVERAASNPNEAGSGSVQGRKGAALQTGKTRLEQKEERLQKEKKELQKKEEKLQKKEEKLQKKEEKLQKDLRTCDPDRRSFYENQIYEVSKQITILSGDISKVGNAILEVGKQILELSKQIDNLDSLPGEPFDIEFIKGVAVDRDFSSIFPDFIGREGFATSMAKSIKEDLVVLDNAQFRGTTSCFATVSGAGKTRGVLELKATLKEALDKEDLEDDIGDVFFGYAGFNSGLNLSDEELSFCTELLKSKSILYRRILGSVVTSTESSKPGTMLPRFEDLYKEREVPLYTDSISQFVKYIKDKRTVESKRTVVVVAIDEVHLLDGYKKIDGVGLGRLFLRFLRQLQLAYRGENIMFVAVGMGITLDFGERDQTTGNNKIIDPSAPNTVLISKEAFRQLVEKKIASNQEAFDKCYVEEKRRLIPGVVTSLFWPNVRSVENWEVGRPPMIGSHSDGNAASWKEWYLRWMCDISMEFGNLEVDSRLVPGRPEVAITAVFTLGEGKTFKVTPDASNIESLAATLESNSKSNEMKNLYTLLRIGAKAIFHKFLGTRMECSPIAFEEFGFNVVASSLYLGLEALDRGYSDVEFNVEFNAVNEKRLLLARWTKDRLDEDWKLQEPRILYPPQSGEQFYPFEAQLSDGHHLHRRFRADFVGDLNDAAESGQPVFVWTGSQAKCDYILLFPIKRGWLAHIGEATRISGANPANVKTDKQQQVRDAFDIVNFALNQAGYDLVDSNLIVFSTSSKLAKAQKVPTFSPGGLNGDMTLLSPKTFEFAPFTDILFALPLAANTEEEEGTGN